MKDQMVGLKKTRIWATLALAFLLLWPWHARAGALVEVRDVHLGFTPERAAMFVLLNRPPQYSLKMDSQGKATVLFDNSKGSARLEQRIIKGDPRLSLEAGERGEVKLVLALGRPIEEVRQAWVGEHNVLRFDFLYKKEQGGQKSKEAEAVTLRRMRFGQRNGFTRIVLDLTGRPRFQLRVTPEWSFTLMLNRTSYIKPLKLKKLKGIKKLLADNIDGNTRVFVQSDYPHLNASLMWLDKGNRLVVDVYDSPAVLRKVDEGIPADFGTPPRVATSKSELKTKSAAHEDKVEKVLLSVPSHPPQLSQKKGSPMASPRPVASVQPDKKSKKRLPEDQALLYGQIMGARDLRDFRKAILLTEEFMARFPDSPVAEELIFLRADSYMKLFEQERAIGYQTVVEAYRKAVEAYPNSPAVPGAYLGMARAARMGGDFYAAMGFINILMEKYAKKDLLPAIYLERAYAYRGINLPDKAFEDFKAIVKRFPESPQSHEASLGIADYLHHRGLYEESEMWLTRLARKNPVFPNERPEYYLLKAKNCVYLKKFDEARELFFQALNMGEAGEGPDLILTRIGDTYWYQGKVQPAKVIYTYVAAHHPASEGAAIAQLRLAEITAGVDAFKEIHEKYRDRPIGELALLKLANLYYKNQDYEGVLDSLKELVLKPPEDEAEHAARTLFTKAAEAAFQKYNETGDHRDVVDMYEAHKEVLADELSPDGRFVLAQAYLALKQYQDATTILKKLDPSDLPPGKRADYYLALATCLKGMGKEEEALSVLKKNRASSPDPRVKAKMELFLADLYRETSRPEEALKTYLSLTDAESFLSPEEVGFLHYHLGSLLNQKSKPREARKHLKRSISIARKVREGRSLYHSALMELAHSYRLERRYREAAEVLEKLISEGLKPDDEFYWDIKFRLAEYYMKSGREGEAVALYKQISEEGPSHLQLLVQLRLGSINLNNQLRRLQYWSEVNGKQRPSSIQ